MDRNIIYEGVEYLAGTAGSLILACPKCGEEHFRERGLIGRYLTGDPPFPGDGSPFRESCFTCQTVMEVIRVDDLESRWRPFWVSLGWEVPAA